MTRPLSARGWALTFAFLILLDDVTDLIDDTTTEHTVLLGVDLIVIMLMLLALFGRQPAKERKG